MPSNFKALAGASGGEPTDPNFKNVTLLLHGDGSNGAQNNTFIDSSTNNFTITRNGNTTQGSFSPYGSNWSNYFDGSGDYLSLPSNTALPTANQSYTIEAWVCPSALTGTHAIIGWGNYGTNNQVNALTISPTSITNYWWARDLSASYTFAVGSWYHIVAQFDGTTRSIYVNGTRVATDTPTGHNVPSPVTNATVGTANNLSEYFNGYISNVRVVTGQAIYSGSTITVPTTPLTAITNTSLLTCADNRFRDGSTNNFTITRNGDVKVTNFSPFAPSAAYSTTTNGGSAYFDGSGDKLATPSSSNLQFGTGDFTIEGWFYRLTSGTTEIPLSLGEGAGTAFIFTFRPSSTTFGLFGGGSVVSGDVTPSNAWTHIAITRSSGTTRLFINGSLSSSGSDTNDYNQGTCYLGSVGAEYYYNGYISNLRLLKGTAQYTAAFTPPASPVTAITNTQLLTNFTNAAIFDNSMKNDLETVGNAQISTSVKKFGTGSMYFDGSGDWLDTLSTYGIGGSEAYTIEGWIYPTSVTGRDFCIYETRGGQGFVLFIDGGSGGYLRVYDSSAGLQTASTTAISANTWTHFALVRQAGSSTNTYYVNGVAAGTFSLSSFAGPTRVRIGARNDAAEAFAGYIDDLRITKGVARYTANFTAPTAPFPNK